MPQDWNIRLSGQSATTARGNSKVDFCTTSCNHYPQPTPGLLAALRTTTQGTGPVLCLPFTRCQSIVYCSSDCQVRVSFSSVPQPLAMVFSRRVYCHLS